MKPDDPWIDNADAAPFGLGWTTRLGGRELTAGLSAEDAFSRRLFLGWLALATVLEAIITPALWWSGALPVLVLSNAFGGLACLVSLVVYPATGRGFAFFVHLCLAANLLATWVNVIPEGGIGVSTQPMWGTAAIMVAGILLGWRHAAVWAAIDLALLVLFGMIGETPSTMTGAERAMSATANHIAFAAAVTVLVLWMIQRQTILLGQAQRERARSDRMLESAVPAEIAQRLRAGENVADLHEDVGVLFADLVGFTKISADLPASRVVRLLSELFDEVDALVEPSGLCKVKTIGDCYMVCSNIPQSRDDHLVALAQFALAMRKMIDGRVVEGHRLGVRIGIHVGPLVAGVIGRQRRLYDVWGDTVNTASRMESTGEPGRIQVSDRVRRRLDGRGFGLVERGVVHAKGLGEVTVFYLEPGTS